MQSRTTFSTGADRGRHLRVESVKGERLMTRLVRCKEGMLRTKKGEQKKCFQLLDSKEPKANGTEIIIRHMAQLE